MQEYCIKPAAVKAISELLVRLRRDEELLRLNFPSFRKLYKEKLRRIEDKYDDVIAELEELLDDVIV